MQSSLHRYERAEEKTGPVPKPRPANASTGVLVDEKEEHQAGLQDNVRRPATESLVHTKLIAEGLFDVSRTSGGRGTGTSPFDQFAANIPRVSGKNPDDPKRSPDAFDVLAKVFDFQQDSVLNQRDNAISMLASRLSRAVGHELENQVTLQDAGLVLEAFRGELLSNYTRWCSFLGVTPVSLQPLFTPPGGERAVEFAMATEGALMLLIWGEAGNLRFCPEFLCFLYHKMSHTFRTVIEGKSPDITVPSYLDEVITPAYSLLAEQLSKIGHGVIDHSSVRNYDDFNEIFWQEECLKLTIATMFEGKTLKKKFQKTFVERQSWLVPIFHFWRVYALHIMGLHVMIVGAKCQQDLGECSYAQWASTVITLYACSFVRDLWDIKQAAYVFGGHRGPFGQLLLNILRGGLKAVITLLLVVMYWSDSEFFPYTAAVFFVIAAASEAVMLTELWWGIASYGKWGTSTERSCAGGGFAACLPSRLRQLGWSFIGSMSGINSVNLYTQVHSLPPITKRVAYILFWALVLTTKILFSYFVVIKKMTLATYTLNEADPTDYDFGVLGTLEDTGNYLYIAALWLGSGLIYFLDMQIWFVVWANIAAACEGVRRRVGELHSGSQVVRAFSHLHKEFFNYLKREMQSTTMHTRFAHVWNEIVDAMREEDILSNRERLQLRYFLINLRLPTADPNARNVNFAPEAQEGEWGPLFTLLPEFLMSGAVQRAVQSASDFGKKIADDVAEIKREESLAMHQSRNNVVRASGVSVNDRQANASRLRAKLAYHQAKFLLTNGNDQVSSEMVRQLSATAFILMDALCRNDDLSRSLWNLHRALFASDVGQGGKGIGKSEGWIAALTNFSDNKDKPAVKVVASFSKRNLLFSVQNFPGFVAAMIELVKALNKHVTTPNWNKDVAAKLDKMVEALLALLETKTDSIPDNTAANAFLKLLQNVRLNLDAWRSSFSEAGGAAPGARPFKSTAKEFLRRTQVFLEAPGNSQPGLIKGAEARRRITFFVNSLFVEQPKKRKVLEMPSLTTLTPYYNEDVVLSMESLREETQDGVTVLEYLRQATITISIYPDEFDNFVERMRVMSTSKSKKYLFDLDVIDPMLDVVLDTELGADLSRDSVLKRVERAIITAVQKKRKNDGLDPVDPKEVEEAAKDVDVDDMMLQLQMWASNRGQTLSRTIRGIMYYSQAVRLLAVVENISEFQPQETGYMFGSSDRPLNDEEADEFQGHDIGDAVNAVLKPKRPRRTESGDGGGGDDAAWRLKFWQRHASGTPTNAAAAAAQQAGGGDGRHIRSQTSFRHFFNRNKKSDLEATLDQDLQQLEDGGTPVVHRRSATTAAGNNNQRAGAQRTAQRKGRSPVRPRGVAAGSAEAGVVDLGDIKGGKLKAAVKRALAASRREKEAAARRGRQKRREEQELGDFQGFIQVKDPALDKSCVEYGLTAELAETKYRWEAGGLSVSKGRDTGVSQVTGFTAKISMGNGMQARSREVGRLASQFDIFRLLSFYYSSVGGFMNQVLLMTAVFLYVYAKLYIAFDPDFVDTVDDDVLDAISSQFLFQLGFLLILPIPLLLAVEQGMQRAVSTLFNIMLRLAPFFFIFSAGTNAHYVNSAVMTGQAKYQATGRGFVIAHEYFVDMFPLYLTSHFNPAFELLVVLIVYASFATSGYFLETFSVYLLIIGLLWTPLVFNPNGLDFTYASQDFTGWMEWMNSPVDDPKKGWLSWYSRVLEETRTELPFGKKLQAIFRRSRLLILVYGFLTAIGEDYDGGIDGDVWPGSVVVGTCMLIVVGLLMCQSWIRSKCCPPKALKGGIQAARWARLSKLFILVGVIVGVIVLTDLDILESIRQFIFYILSFVILIYYVSQIVVLFMEDALRNVALVNLAFKSVHLITGIVIIAPVLLLSFFPLFVDLQTRMLFNEDFSQRFSIAKIFARQSNRRHVKKND
ncbi:1,3-beta-glucan synthase, family GT48 [Ectocarpus siliculosus]|uniref:1,3-beta-glucan synthase n=1 Tax=Ectocarpus siliculosus TaxID=2880 RepID=D7FPK0_ECTSI|nr:1,3-beta-glucan synthase, family GT48 [Ectocarpus siliculosus]|eukprot:CBJ30457.1 1,3-beta-glucan synthase, family GT48 [Ectocarpus siliculosus]